MKSPSRHLVLFLAFFPTLLVLGFYAKVKFRNTPVPGKYYPLSAIPKDSLKKTPQLNLTGDHKKEEKNPVLTKLQIDVKVIGNIATTTMDMTFYNDNARILEGELIFPLGEGQTVSRFALEVNGNLREAVVVDKNKGQQVYEELIRQKVDPGLVEQVQGNSYKARVYPLPPKGNKRLIIAYEQELPSHGPDQYYYLPLNYGQTINDFALHIDVAQQKVMKNPEGIIIDYKEEGNKTVADLHEKNFNANSFLAFTIEDSKSNKVYVEDVNGKKYFYAPVKIKGESRPKKLPSSIALFWDASGSGASRDIAKELNVLKSYFSKINSLKLTVITFANKILEEKQFTLAPGNFNELENYIKTITYDGATQFNSLDFNKYNAGEIILMSDGLSNFGKVTTQNSGVPIITMSSLQQSDFDLLKYLSQSTGGNFINLNTTKPEDALNQSLNEPLRIISINYNQDKSIDKPSEIFPTPGTIISNGFSITGISASNSFEMNIAYGYGNEKTGEASILVNPAKAENYDGLIKRIWAQKKLQNLLLQTEKNKEEIIACAVENKIVTPFTSLLVLDRLEDYIRYKITPPGEFKAAYDSALTAAKTEEIKTNKAQLEKVINLFNERKSWWEKDFTPMQKPVNKKEKTDSTTGERPIPGEVNIRNRNQARTTTAPMPARGTANGVQHEERSVNSYDSYEFHYSSGAGAANSTPNTVEDSYNTNTYYISNADNAAAKQTKTVSANLTAWEPNMPYITELKKVGPENLYSKYLDLKKTYGTSPSFYLDAADLFTKQSRPAEALRIASNLAEIELKNYRLLRVLAHKLEQTGNMNDAIELYRQVMELRKEEPQSYRDLGLALARNNQPQEAIEMLYKIVEKNWDNRFPEIEVMVMGEINNIISTSRQKLNTAFIDSKLIKAMPVDARVILNWDADNCDIDLWVTDPNGEKCFYGHRATVIGGRNSPDFTGGYGPEEFMIKKAMKGIYKVEINYYGTREQTILGPTTIQVEMYNNYCKPNVKLNEVTRRLSEKQETIEIGTFVVE